MTHHKPSPVAGDRFGRGIVIETFKKLATDNQNRTHARLTCDCGTEYIAEVRRLNSGQTRSCGCLQREIASTAVAMAHTTHGVSRHYLFPTWQRMVTRTTDPSSPDYPRYGGRGITVHPIWLEHPEAFIDFADHVLGQRPDTYTLDRIDNAKGYEPGNLRWASRSEQTFNRSVGLSEKTVRDIRRAHANGQTVSSIARGMGITYSVVRNITLNRTYKGYGLLEESNC
jgi:hypothetical protein